MKTLLTILLVTLLPLSAFAAREKMVLGWVEHIVVEPSGLALKAKLDTGAKTSSIRANITREYKKGKHTWITYEILGGKAGNVTMDSKVVRWVKIRKKDKTAGFLRRPVVKLGFCIDDKLIVGEVNLSPRSGFLYPVLIGRNMMKQHILVDTHRMLTTKPHCNQQKPKK